MSHLSFGRFDRLLCLPSFNSSSSSANDVYRFNFAGVGVLALPYALSNVGIVPGLFLLVAVGLATLSSYTLLLRTKRLTGHSSYEALSLHLFGPALSTLVKCVIILGTIAALTAYLTIIADSTQKFFINLLPDEHPLVAFLDKKTILAVALFIVVPLSLTRRIESLTWTSTVSLMPLLYLMALLAIYFVEQRSRENGDDEDVDLTRSAPLFNSNLFIALPICTFAFSSQVGSIPIFSEMEKLYGATQRDMLKVAAISIGASFFFYAFCGILGLLTFAEIQPNIVLSFDRSAAVDILLVSMIISVALGYPFSLFPCRDSLQSLFFAGHRETRRRTVLLTLGIISVSYLIASFVSYLGPSSYAPAHYCVFRNSSPEQTSLSSVLSLSGGFTGTITGYILPSAFYLKATKEESFKSDRYRILATTVVVLGSTTGFLTTWITISGFMSNSSSSVAD